MNKKILIAFFIVASFFTAYKYIYAFQKIDNVKNMDKNEINNIDEVGLYKNLTLFQRERVRDVYDNFIVISGGVKLYTTGYDSIIEKNEIKKGNIYNIIASQQGEDYYLTFYNKYERDLKNETKTISPLLGELYLIGNKTNTGLDLYIEPGIVIGEIEELEKKVKYLNDNKIGKSNYIIVAAEGSINGDTFYSDRIYLEDKDIFLQNKISNYNKNIEQLELQRDEFLKTIESSQVKNREDQLIKQFEDNGIEYSPNKSFYNNRLKAEEHFEYEIEKNYQNYSQDIYLEYSKFQ